MPRIKVNDSISKTSSADGRIIDTTKPTRAPTTAAANALEQAELALENTALSSVEVKSRLNKASLQLKDVRRSTFKGVL